MNKIPPDDPATWKEFGVFLFECREADPGYYVLDYLRNDGYDKNQLYRFAVAWCSFYNLGIAAQASELSGKKFYEFLVKVYPTATRASERRHFRGAAGLKALGQWHQKFKHPEEMVDWILAESPDLNMGSIRKACDSVAQMGDYFKWKWGDLGEVLLQQPVQFRGWEEKSPKVPQEGAMLIAAEEKPGATVTQVYHRITQWMIRQGVTSPYADWRQFDVQDAETICCVYKQYRSGGYIPGLRTAKAANRLRTDGGGCRTAEDALDLLLDNQPRKEFSQIDKLVRILEGEKRYTVDRFV